MCNYITVTSENDNNYGGYMWILSVKYLGYILNNINFADLHVLMSTTPSLAISSQDSLVKFDAILMVLIGSLVLTCHTSAINNALKVVNSRQHSLEI